MITAAVADREKQISLTSGVVGETEPFKWMVVFSLESGSLNDIRPATSCLAVFKF